jgi:DNA-binding LacI/PurR family transcriptional regulator
MQSLLGRRPRPTAIFAMSDEMAMGAMRACHEAGLDVPGDVSIVGFDDVDWAFTVGLTTVRQDATELGAIAARLMIERLEGIACERRLITVPTQLVERSSTAPPVG